MVPYLTDRMRYILNKTTRKNSVFQLPTSCGSLSLINPLLRQTKYAMNTYYNDQRYILCSKLVSMGLLLSKQTVENDIAVVQIYTSLRLRKQIKTCGQIIRLLMTYSLSPGVNEYVKSAFCKITQQKTPGIDTFESEIICPVELQARALPTYKKTIQYLFFLGR